MNLLPKHYVGLICEASKLTENEILKLFIEQYNQHIFKNRNFVNELNTWTRNVYSMYKTHLHKLKVSDPKIRSVNDLYWKKIPFEDFIDQEFMPENTFNSSYNKGIWGKINWGFIFFSASVKKQQNSG